MPKEMSWDGQEPPSPKYPARRSPDDMDARPVARRRPPAIPADWRVIAVQAVWGVATGLVLLVWGLFLLRAMVGGGDPIRSAAVEMTFVGPIGATVAVYVVARGVDRLLTVGRDNRPM
jgi:hypothetical protein